MILTKDEERLALNQLIKAVDDSSILRSKIQLWIWVMLERLDNIYKRQERYGDI